MKPTLAVFFALTPLIVMFIVAIVGYLSGKSVRERDVTISIDETAAAPGQA